MLSSKTWPTICNCNVLCLYTTNSRTKNALNTIVWGCGLCLVVPVNEVMIGSKYRVGWPLVGLTAQAQIFPLPFYCVSECPKNLQHLWNRIWQFQLLSCIQLLLHCKTLHESHWTLIWNLQSHPSNGIWVWKDRISAISKECALPAVIRVTYW